MLFALYVSDQSGFTALPLSRAGVNKRTFSLAGDILSHVNVASEQIIDSPPQSSHHLPCLDEHACQRVIDEGETDIRRAQDRAADPL